MPADSNELRSLRVHEKMLTDSIAQREASGCTDADYLFVTNGERNRLKEVQSRIAELTPAPAAATAESTPSH